MWLYTIWKAEEQERANVPRTGVEPVISGMKAQRPRPLDERGIIFLLVVCSYLCVRTRQVKNQSAGLAD
jgi:hypothetical protein